MTFEEWWPKPEVPMPMWFASLRAGFTACWIQATDEATRAERERCAERAYQVVLEIYRITDADVFDADDIGGMVKTAILDLEAE